MTIIITCRYLPTPSIHIVFKSLRVILGSAPTSLTRKRLGKEFYEC